MESHLMRGGSVESVPSLPGEGRECGECTIITW